MKGKRPGFFKIKKLKNIIIINFQFGFECFAIQFQYMNLHKLNLIILISRYTIKIYIYSHNLK